MIECPGCRLKLPDYHLNPPVRVNASGECLQLFSDLRGYTVGKQDPGFIHQRVVDTCAAQHAGGPTRTITVAFGLIGLYLCAGERIYRETGAGGTYEDRTHQERLAPARTSRTTNDPDRAGCTAG
jgi:hypothetical protein